MGLASQPFLVPFSFLLSAMYKKGDQQGVFCANFWKPMLGLQLCQCTWCMACYKGNPGNDFLIYHKTDGEGNNLVTLDEELDLLPTSMAGGSSLLPLPV